MRVLGLDLGTRTIGVAVSDEEGLTAAAVKTIRRTSTERDYEEVLSLIEEYGAGEVVVGLPVNLDGSYGPRARAALRFVEVLRKRTKAAVKTWDERFSTAAVTRAMIEADLSRRRRRKAVDSAAAAYILQGYLDYRRARAREGAGGL